MRILITGAAGFIGCETALALRARGDEVIGIDNLNEYYNVALKHDRRERIERAGATFLPINFADMAALQDGLAGQSFDRIIHLGAQAGVRYSITNPHSYAQSNLVGHLNMLELARDHGVEHMIYASSSSVYGLNEKQPFAVEDRVDHPLSLYAATKKADELMSETYAHLYRLPMTGLRFFTVYGPWGRPDMMMWIFTAKILAGQPIPVFNHGKMRRDFTYIDDIVAGVIACLDAPPTDNGVLKPGGSKAPHAIYNIGNNRPEELMKVITLLEQACGKKAKMEMLPMQAGDVTTTYADIDAIAANMGYVPKIPVEVGVPRFVDWYREWHDL